MTKIKLYKKSNKKRVKSKRMNTDISLFHVGIVLLQKLEGVRAIAGRCIEQWRTIPTT
jgi:hypothetical protein